MQSDDQLENTNEELAVNDSVPEAMAAEASSDKAKVAPKRRQGETAARKGTARKRVSPKEKISSETVQNDASDVVEVAPKITAKAKRKTSIQAQPPPRLLNRFRQEIRPALLKEFGYKSPMQVPQVVKVVINMGLGEAITNARALDSATQHMTILSGQRPVITKARKSIAGFKIREGMSIGCMVTLRGHRMYEFLDRLLSVALPRIRDFRGVSRYSFDGKGNYSLGLREQIVFPEIDYSIVDRIRGFQVIIGTSARNDQEGMRLLELMGMPFSREQQAN